MVTKLKNVNGVLQTGIENIVIFSYFSKIAIFDLKKREILKEIKIRDCGFLNHVALGKYVGIYAHTPCLIDLERMEVVKKFSARNIVNKLLLANNFQPSEYYFEIYGDRIVDLLSDKLLYLVNYAISPLSDPQKTERHAFICYFDIVKGNLLNYEELKIENPILGISYNREEPEFCFLEYDDGIIDKEVSSIKIKKEKNFTVLFYNKKYNVLFFRNGDYCYSYYIDFRNEENDEVVIPEIDLFNKPGFDEQDYIRKNGLTDEVLNYFSDEVLLDGGYFWALDSIERKEIETHLSFANLLKENKITDEELILFSVGLFETFLENDGLDQYFSSEENEGVEYLIKALQLVGAKETVKVIKKGVKIQSDKRNIDKSEEFINLEEELDEDYVGMSIQYIKNSKLQ